jgi:hypothetical protein
MKHIFFSSAAKYQDNVSGHYRSGWSSCNAGHNYFSLNNNIMGFYSESYSDRSSASSEANDRLFSASKNR